MYKGVFSIENGRSFNRPKRFVVLNTKRLKSPINITSFKTVLHGYYMTFELVVEQDSLNLALI